MDVIATALPGVLILKPRIFRDARGEFVETWSRDRYAAAGLPREFVQDNVSRSAPGVLRGLHYQHPNAQGKLVQALQGAVFDVAVDIRPDSPTYRQWVGAILSAANGHQMYVPEGYAHGFVVTEGPALFAYKCTAFYSPKDEGKVRWDDPDLAIAWPLADPILAPADAAAPRLRDVPLDRLPRLGAAGR